ncbi:MAG: hypothetical protein GY761_13135 [Hyphomicrobiales bacterium]|nr:hypothetical protein [Hyphomicrobiales bacterium]
MTQTSLINRVSMTGDGATTVFPFNNFVEDAGDLEVWLRTSAGVETLQTISTHYTLAGLGGADVSVTMITAPASGERLVMIRKEPHTNEVAVDDVRTFRAQAFEDQFDRIARGQQRIEDEVERSIRLKDTDLEDATGEYDANSRKIINVADAANDNDAVNKSQMDAAVAAGQAGPQGETGSQAGHEWDWHTATADADQGTGRVWGNNAALANITVLYFDNLDQSGADVTAWLTRLDDSTTTADRGTLLIEKESDKTKWVEFTVTGAVTAAGSYYKVPVFFLGSGGSFLLDDDIIANFSRSGNAGAGNGDFEKDGSIAMTGNFDGGGNNITNVGLVDGRDVAADGVKLDATYKPNKYDASAAPTVNDDSANSSGNGVFAVGSRWIDSINDETWMCADDTATAAVWKNLSLDTSELGTGALLDETTAAQFRSNTADKLLSTDQVFDAMAEVTLTYAATVAIDMDAFFDAVLTLTGNAILDNPTNVKRQTGLIRVVQDATGSRTLSFASYYEFAGGSAPVLSTTANAEDLLFYKVLSSTRIFISLVAEVS